MAAMIQVTDPGGVSVPSDPLIVTCNDCLDEAVIPHSDAAQMLDALHGFLGEHSLCSYDVTLTAFPRQRDPDPG
jgi:hypothetical protein